MDQMEVMAALGILYMPQSIKGLILSMIVNDSNNKPAGL
jgi:hypothetical protein